MHLLLSLTLLCLALAATVEAYTSPRFIVKHRSSGLCYAYADWWAWGHHYEKFRADSCSNAAEVEWVQKEGHWGYLRIVGTGGHCMNPLGGWASPGDNTALFPHPNCYNSALFAIDQEKGIIKHSGGKYVHVYPYQAERPNWHSDLMLHSGLHRNIKFDFVQKGNPNQKVQVIPNPQVKGEWQKVSCWYNVHVGSLKFTMTIGTSKTSSSSLTNTWELSVGVAKGIVEASATYGGSFTTTDEQQWKAESTIERTITVTKEYSTLCLWQWVYEFEQFNDGFRFRSFTIRETRSDAKPTEIPGSKK
ncbi:uncharacterized protein LOC106151985 [Lingula anatina]|uniref:Uncharacterized protein LOC106151985 n=1 Tax=Lingula anatina TaxID=7574 RepID=A0A1S3H5Y9_LINAN|nr:uncharacterized protein LOC106151985 [Lingula anatina]|eukprot:XP_013380891.1 uncharacterized protein LOC106151985 [Lingula anatina]